MPDDAAPRSRSAARPTKVETASTFANFARRRILVADDNPVNAMLAQRLLQTLDCHADIVASGLQALALHASQAYDIVIMDCQMAGLDGFAATRQLRAAERGERKTVVVGWTTAAEAQRADCIASGMDDVLPKPVSKQSLVQMLHRWCPSAGAAEIESAAIDPGVEDELKALRELFDDDFEEVANIYTQETPRRLAALDTCLANNDLAGAARLAHAVSGSSASIGARAVSRACHALELACLHGAPPDAPLLRMQIDLAYANFGARLAAAIAAARG